MTRLKIALRLDAVVTAANGAAYLTLAGPVGDVLELSPSLLRTAGAFLLAFACVVWLAGTRDRPSRPLVAAIIAANAVWAVDSVVAAAAGWGSPSTTGTVWIVLQALVVAGFAGLQLAGLRRTPRVEREVASAA